MKSECTNRRTVTLINNEAATGKGALPQIQSLNNLARKPFTPKVAARKRFSETVASETMCNERYHSKDQVFGGQGGLLVAEHFRTLRRKAEQQRLQ